MASPRPAAWVSSTAESADTFSTLSAPPRCSRSTFTASGSESLAAVTRPSRLVWTQQALPFISALCQPAELTPSAPNQYFAVWEPRATSTRPTARPSSVG